MGGEIVVVVEGTMDFRHSTSGTVKGLRDLQAAAQWR